MRVRKFTNRGSTTKVIGKFPSRKGGSTVWFESQLERDMIFLLEFDSAVIFYREQPLRLGYDADGVRRTYVPDFLVERKEGLQIIEVKYEDDAAKPENRLLFARVTPVFERHRMRFDVVTERDIRRQPRLDTIKLLWRYRNTPVEPRHVIRCHEMLSRGGAVRFGDLIALFDGENGRAIVYALIYRGELHINLDEPLNDSAVMRSPDAVENDGVARDAPGDDTEDAA